MKLVFSVDDGSKLDYKTAALLKQYGFTGIFYIPSKCELSIPEIKHISENHIIAGHTVTHPLDMKLLSDEDLKFQIEHNKNSLESIIGKEITSFCYPRGRYDDRVVKAVKDAGFKEARTTVVLNTDLPEDNYRIKTSVHVYPARDEYKEEYWLDVAKAVFDFAKMKGDKGYYHVWMHSWEIDKFAMWEEFEELLKYIKENL